MHHTALMDWLDVDVPELSSNGVDVSAIWRTGGNEQKCHWYEGHHYVPADGRTHHSDSPAPVSWLELITLKNRFKELTADYGRKRFTDDRRGGPARHVLENLYSPVSLRGPHRSLPLSEVKIVDEFWSNRDDRIAEIENGGASLLLIDGEPWMKILEPYIEVSPMRRGANLRVRKNFHHQRPWKETYFRLTRLSDAIDISGGCDQESDLEIDIIIPESFTLDDDHDALYHAAHDLVDSGYHYLKYMSAEEGADWFRLKEVVGAQYTPCTATELFAAAIRRFQATLCRLPIQTPYATIRAKEALTRWDLRLL